MVFGFDVVSDSAIVVVERDSRKLKSFRNVHKMEKRKMQSCLLVNLTDEETKLKSFQ